MIMDMIRGLVIGVAMLIPGVSGGTMALILGIYYKLIASVDTFFEDIHTNLKFLLSILIGGALGILIFSRSMLYLYETYKIPMVYLFMGAVTGSLPLLYKSSGVGKFNLKALIWPIIGISVVILIGALPENMIDAGSAGILKYFIIFFVGILLSTALVLPGISFSYMLLILGLYENTLAAIKSMDIIYILSMGMGLLIGTFLTAKVIRIILRKHPVETYLVIIGFVIASLRDVFPGIPMGNDLFISLGLFAFSFILIYNFSKKR